MFRILFGCLLFSGAMAMAAAAENAPGVTDREIKIGQTMPYTGPGAWLSSVGLAEKAYMQMINDQGGINGRKINLISVDDGFEAVKLGRKFCGKKCQSEHRRFPRVYSVFASGSYTPSAEHRSDSKSAHSTGLKTRLRVVRGSGDPAVEHRIGPDDYPVNILGGHRWPDAPKLGSTIETVLWKEVGPLTDLTAYDLPEAA